jgi:homoserine dehydrogenase
VQFHRRDYPRFFAVKIALLGAGTVGGGVLRLLRENRAQIAKRAGQEITPVIVAVRDVDRARQRLGYDDVLLSDDALSAATHPDADAVVELIGGESIARECALAALANNRPLVTANKALLAKSGAEIFQAAAARNLTVGFEAAIGGAIPIVKTLREALAANRVDAVCGIINGTCNFILSAMEKSDCDFAAALAEATKLGYAEADPSLDLSGADAAHKIALIAALAFGAPPRFAEVKIQGIAGINGADIRAARDFGYCIKLLAIARRTDSGALVYVRPALLPHGHLLAAVGGAMNAVMVDADAAGDTIYYGAGAGSAPTASAVVADLIDLAAKRAGLPPECDAPLTVADLRLHPTPHYLRFTVIDRPGVLAQIAQILAARMISIEAIRQTESRENEPVDVVFLTHKSAHGAVLDAAAEIERLDFVAHPATVMAIEEL